LKADFRTRWTAAELMMIEFPPARFAVPGLIAEGANLLAGSPKIGKSWFALNLAVAVASGGKACGRIQVDAGDVLYLALEDPGRRLQSRIRVMLCDDEPAPERLTLETWCEPLADGGSKLVEEWLDEHPDARLVIVDVFTRVRGHVNDRQGRYEADYQAMATLKDLADQYGVPFLIVHHTRKAHAEDFLDLVSGTQGLAGAADAVLVLTRSRGASEAVLKVTGRDIEEAEFAMNFAADLGTWQMLVHPVRVEVAPTASGPNVRAGFIDAPEMGLPHSPASAM
jgi:RecA-family ATPase